MPGSFNGQNLERLKAKYGPRPLAAADVNWTLHGNAGTSLEVKGGTTNIAYADGHVSTESPEALGININTAQARSTLAALWTLFDEDFQGPDPND